MGFYLALPDLILKKIFGTLAFLWINEMILYFYTINAWKKLVVMNIFIFDFVRLAGPSWLWDAPVLPRAAVWGQAVPGLVPMDIMAVTARFWR